MRSRERQTGNREVIQLDRPRKWATIVAIAAASAIAACAQPAPTPTAVAPATVAPAAAPTTAAAAASPVTKPVVAPSPAISPAAAPAASPAAAPAASPAAQPTPLTAQQLTDISPGLSSYMLETARRMGRSWFAAQSNNWDEAAFEIREARGVLQAGARISDEEPQKGIAAFIPGFLDPLIVTAQSGNKTQYEAGYTSALQGCNACHASQTYDETNQPFSFIRVQVPTRSIWDVFAYTK
jgi:hypothetical protein